MQEREEGAFSPSFGRSPLSLSLSYLPPSDASDHVLSYLLPTSAFAPTTSTCLPHVSSRAPLGQPYDAFCFLPASLGQMHHPPCSYFSCPELGPFCRVQPFWQLQYHAYRTVLIFFADGASKAKSLFKVVRSSSTRVSMVASSRPSSSSCSCSSRHLTSTFLFLSCSKIASSGSLCFGGATSQAAARSAAVSCTRSAERLRMT